jgi:acyl dehydratase
LYFEDVNEGDELPAVMREPVTATQLVMYCGASAVSDPIHYDLEIAKASGFPDLVVNGPLRVGFLAQLLTDWAYPGGWIERFNVQHRGLALRGDAINSRGRVTRKYVEGDKACVECEIWNETARLGQTDVGTAVVSLARRGGAGSGA